MAVFKCKMCGGDLEITEGMTIAQCDYCGTTQTVPKSMDENLQNLFNRANTLRIKSEFDKAEKLYEKIIQADSTQSDAYWGLILCKYGIEYVDDPKTFKKIPTCHRASYDSIIADDDYKMAIMYADAAQCEVYKEQAREIDRIQREILALAQNEETYDVFICYKETDANGQRTQDSVIANDIYYELTKQGYKVFYAAITLEGKLGSAYEPVIFAALSSAKVMLAIGTKPEYFSAVWVKNEWSRFLRIIKSDRSKLLIPCYRDMDAYELPEEFAHLQAQDMSKIGFINDIVRGIGKVIKTDEPKVTVVKETVVNQQSAGNVAPLLKRAFMFLEDEDWDAADQYFEKVLDLDPECAEAYLGQLMVFLKVKTRDGLARQTVPLSDSNEYYYRKAIRFASPELKAELEGYNAKIEENINEDNYKSLVDKMNKARTEADFKSVAGLFTTLLRGYKDSDELAKRCTARAEECRKDAVYATAENKKASSDPRQLVEAAKLFRSVSGYKDADEQAKECDEKAEECRKNAIYVDALKMKNHNTPESLAGAAKKFRVIPGWKDSDEQAKECDELHAKLLEKQEAEQAERIRLANEEIEQRYAKKRRRQIITWSIIGLLIALSVFAVVFITVISPSMEYNDAVVLFDEGKYEEALSAFQKLGDFKDSEDKILECNASIFERKYKAAVVIMDEGKYEEAIEAFRELNGYNDSIDKIDECNAAIFEGKYNSAVALMDEGKYEEAIAAFEVLDGYSVSEDKIAECNAAIIEGKYNAAVALMDSGKYNEAIAAFGSLDGYNDSADKIKLCEYNKAQVLLDSGNYDKAIVAFEALGNYSDSADKINLCNYNKAAALANEGKIAEAAMAFGRLGDFSDARDRSFDLWDKIAVRETISAAGSRTVGVRNDGTVVAKGYIKKYDFTEWTDIIAVSSGLVHTVGLKSDGTVVATGDNEDGQCNVSSWTDIVAITAGRESTIGLKSDGTVVAVGTNGWGQCDVSDWSNIVAVAAGFYHSVGLRSDGTVVTVGDDRCDAYSWNNIVAISAGDEHTVGLKSDGTVVAKGNQSDDRCDVYSLNNIVAISAGDTHTVGLRSNGTVVSRGNNFHGKGNVSDWTDIVAVSASYDHTVGLRSDGTVIAVGENDYGECDVSEWKDIKIPTK